MSVLIDQFPVILQGFWMTIRLTALSAVIALVFGTLLAAMRVSPTPPLRLAADAPKLERIIENLLVNAAKHTPAGTTIWVRVHAQEGGVLLLVEDEGPGVPAQLREPIFQPFHQGRNIADHAPGSGIGLALVAQFASLHGGRAWVQDRPGGGASFRVFLPDTPSADVPQS